jgi:phage shock protein B
MWIALHYRSRRRDDAQLSADERATIEALTRTAERMESRIGALEKILDAEVPQWRQTWKDHGR